MSIEVAMEKLIEVAIEKPTSRSGNRDTYSSCDREAYRDSNRGPIKIVWNSIDKKTINILYTYNKPKNAYGDSN